MALCFLVSVAADALVKGPDQIQAVLRLLGAESAEQVDSEEMERLSELLENPVMLNEASVNELVSSGLMSRYQAVSLVDYRNRHGDVLSASELALVDGFGKTHAEIIAPFLSFATYRYPGQVPRKDVANDIVVRTSVRESGNGPMIAYGAKYRLEYGDILKGNISLSQPSLPSIGLPEMFSGGLSFSCRGLKILAGNFNARFGQGLAMWSGMSMSGMNVPSAFMKRPSGLSLPWSFTGGTAFTGVGAEYSAGRMVISAFCAAPGIKEKGWSRGRAEALPAVNLMWWGRSGQISLTHFAQMSFSDGKGMRIPDMKTSLDAQVCLDGVNIYAETAWDWVSATVAALMGTDFRVGENSRIYALGRYYPASYTSSYCSAARSGTSCSNEYGLALGMESVSCTLCLDGSVYPFGKTKDESLSTQIKAFAEWKSKEDGLAAVKLRMTERWRTWGHPFRTELRTDVAVHSGCWTAALRLDGVQCDGYGLLGYIEGSCVSGSLKAYLRQGFFLVDDWDDRIYVYERNAPGSFSVPAFYGRGLWTAFYASYAFLPSCRLYMRIAYTGYPFMPVEDRKDSRFEAALQLAVSL